MKYVVTYVHLVEHTYDAIVEADSYEEAQRKIEDEMDFITEEEVDWQGVSIEVIEVEEA